jgi:energy-coupling factor transporter ATP-binding protein EcfA2
MVAVAALHGNDDWRGSRSHSLSIGGKKRICRIFLSLHPEVLTLDESTSNLNPSDKGALVALLKQLQMNKDVVTYDLELVGTIYGELWYWMVVKWCWRHRGSFE